MSVWHETLRQLRELWTFKGLSCLSKLANADINIYISYLLNGRTHGIARLASLANTFPYLTPFFAFCPPLRSLVTDWEKHNKLDSPKRDFNRAAIWTTKRVRTKYGVGHGVSHGRTFHKLLEIFQKVFRNFSKSCPKGAQKTIKSCWKKTKRFFGLMLKYTNSVQQK